MREHQLPVLRTARYYTLGERDTAREVWIVCHGYAQLAARFLERFRALDDGTRYLVAPEGLSRFYLTENPSERRVGASWMTKEDRLNEIADYVTYLDAIHKEVVGGAALPMTALGFSQGTATVCRWAALGSARVDRLIVWGGEVPPDLDLTTAETAGRLRAARMTLVYGRSDAFFTPKVVAQNEARLREQNIPYAIVPFDGGHEIAEAVLREVAARRV
jgi:predicted esterase